MRLLVDHDVYFVTVQLLREMGHDVVPVRGSGLQKAPDATLLRVANESGRLMVTRDKGFGALAFLSREAFAGVMLLRVSPSTLDEVHEEMVRVFQEHS